MNFADLSTYIASLPDDEREALEDEGLHLHQHLAPGGYDVSPPGYLAFASTGGDGVQFSIFSEGAGPVVMTVPMAFDNPNIVVGIDLHDFLSLGCVSGYFGLEQIAYDMHRAVCQIENAKAESPALHRLSEYFDLRPWQAVEQRLAALKTAYPLIASD